MKYLYTFWGKVRKGKNRGKRLGFPTANINLKKNIPQGVYISKSKVQGKIYPSLTFVGRAKTFGETFYHAETYILNFEKSIYNFWISIKLIKKLRENKKFNSEKDLVEQMKKDRKKALEFHSS
ncbi:MAG: riboflavin kinase [Candidatus Levybacteria bacterium]|nr:riboflavin kinase [Candidatus Levybacteria bacterium]